MILLVGIADDPCIELVRERLSEKGARYCLVDQRTFIRSSQALKPNDGPKDRRWHSELPDGSDLQQVQAVYMRLENLDKLLGKSKLSVREEASQCQDDFLAWTEMTNARVVTRDGVGASNWSKPYQLQLIAAAGFDIPDTVITNSISVAQAFYESRKRVVYKSISGVRSIAQELTAPDLDRLELLKHCPVQFQEMIIGLDVRVHVVGDQVFPVAIEKSEVDYRYGETKRYAPYRLPVELEQRCVKLAHQLGLEFAGVDLILSDSGRAYCLEVNPMPGYGHFQLHTGVDIAGGLADLLMS
jgi:hypothetical protein